MEKKNDGKGHVSDIIGIILFIGCIASLWVFVDWSVDLGGDRARIEENCINAEKSLGDSIYQERPDCRAVLEGLR